MRPLLLLALTLALLCAYARAQTPTPAITDAPVEPCVVTLTVAPVGANCSNASLPSGSGVVCERGSLCRPCSGANCTSDLVCTARPRINEPCPTPASLPCFHPTFTGLACVSGTCRFANVFGPGEACFASEAAFSNGGCVTGLTCTNGTCGTVLAANAPCSPGASACAAGLFCSASGGNVCTARLPENAPCDADFQCSDSLICSARGGNDTLCVARFQVGVDAECDRFGDCGADLFCSLGVCRAVALAQNCTGSTATPQCNKDTNCTCTADGQRKCIGPYLTAAQIAADLAFRKCLTDNHCFPSGGFLGFGPRACWATHCCAEAGAALNVSTADNCTFATPTTAPAPTTAAPAPTTATPAPPSSVSSATSTATSVATTGTTAVTSAATTATTAVTSAATTATTGVSSASNAVTTAVSTATAAVTGIEPSAAASSLPGLVAITLAAAAMLVIV